VKAARHAQRTMLPRRIDEQLPCDAHVETWLDYLITHPEVPLTDIEPAWARNFVSWLRD